MTRVLATSFWLDTYSTTQQKAEPQRKPLVLPFTYMREAYLKLVNHLHVAGGLRLVLNDVNVR